MSTNTVDTTAAKANDEETLRRGREAEAFVLAYAEEGADLPVAYAMEGFVRELSELEDRHFENQEVPSALHLGLRALVARAKLGLSAVRVLDEEHTELLKLSQKMSAESAFGRACAEATDRTIVVLAEVLARPGVDRQTRKALIELQHFVAGKLGVDTSETKKGRAA